MYVNKWICFTASIYVEVRSLGKMICLCELSPVALHL